MIRLLRGLVPRDSLTRRLALQSVISAFGDGAFLTGSAFYFTQLVGLSAQHVGLGLSIGAGVQFLASVPTGRWVDRFGAKQAWVSMAAAQAALYFLWPAVDGFVAFLLMMAAMSVVEQTMRSGRGAYQIAIFPRDKRVASQAFMRAARNVGYTLGALLAGLALAFESDTAMELVPILTGVLLVANTVWVWRLPRLTVEPAAPEPVLEQALEHSAEKGSALRNRGFLLMSIFNGILGTHQVLLNVVIPLWLVEETDAPRVLLAWLFGTNTLLAVLLQVAAARGVTTVQESLRAQYRGTACFVLSCGIVLVTHDTTGWVTIVLVWVGHVTVTGAELFQSAGMWGLVAELSDPDRLGDYQGVSSLGYTLGDVWAPAVYTYLAMTLGAPGWIIIALIVVASAVAIGPAARAAERYLAGGVPIGADGATDADLAPH
ncbi:Sugar phosphate permease [Nocardioides terrae]|uniref:Sugar phosphate permease n=1 Tax=Nocardioides terrae TaxID=574651 RepID=A0A1I1HCY6_9ACTN|nr:MFS transporter [Nocardioides terrae]SFC21867.1 Sugar phosphate permease [Nocardioides terrae]